MYDYLKLENQLCFPLYACSKEIIKKYQPFLKQINLTYTQYIVMLVLWEENNINVKSLGQRLYLDSGTLTPLLKKLELEEYIIRKRSNDDERQVIITLTSKGKLLKEKSKHIPEALASCIPLSREESNTLYQLLYKILNSSNKN